MLRYWQNTQKAKTRTPATATVAEHSYRPTGKYDAIVVGAGPAGTTAACFMARQGMSVLLLERGSYEGSKNCGGANLISEHTHKLFPNFWEECPCERVVTDQSFWWMTEDSVLSSRFRSRKLAASPYNRFTIKRRNLYGYLSAKAVEAGVILLLNHRADKVVFSDNQAVGILVTSTEQAYYLADLIILADGANSLLAEKAGLNPRVTASNMSLYVKETIALPGAILEERLGLLPGEGTIIGLFGYPTQGFNGTASIQTFKDSLNISVGMSVTNMIQAKVHPATLLERIKNHPHIQPLLARGESIEYGGAMIPEGGYHAIPQLVHDGLLIIGDAASLVNGVQGINLAMWSGYYSAQAAYAAKMSSDFSSRKLRLYNTLLEESFILQDLKANAGVAKMQVHIPYLFDLYTRIANEGAYEVTKVYTMPKQAKRKLIFQKLTSMQPLAKMAQDIWQVLKVIR